MHSLMRASVCSCVHAVYATVREPVYVYMRLDGCMAHWDGAGLGVGDGGHRPRVLGGTIYVKPKCVCTAKHDRADPEDAAAAACRYI